MFIHLYLLPTSFSSKAFDLLTDHLVRYFDEAKKHTHGILTQIMKTFRYERGSDGPRISALRCLRKVMRRLPSELSLTHSEECGRVEPQGDTRLISVQSVWDLLLSELRFGHPTRKTKSLSMIEALLKVSYTFIILSPHPLFQFTFYCYNLDTWVGG